MGLTITPPDRVYLSLEEHYAEDREGHIQAYDSPKSAFKFNERSDGKARVAVYELKRVVMLSGEVTETIEQEAQVNGDDADSTDAGLAP